jgi:RNA polymerase sigma-70 factor (ECF subfamily)
MQNVTLAQERELVDRLQRRDPEALGRLYDCYGRLVSLTILSVVNDVATAEDLCQETFLKAWTHIATFDASRGSLRTWLQTAARNRALDYVRSFGGRMAVNSVELEDDSISSTGFEADLLHSDQVRAVRQALDRLPENYRTVLQLAYDHGLTHSEIAGRLRRPLGTVKSWVRAALRTVRAELAFE